MEVRRYVSQAEVARCSFKNKAIEEVEVFFFNTVAYNMPIHIKAISLTSQVAVGAIAKCLRLFAENQQYLHSFDTFAYCRHFSKGMRQQREHRCWQNRRVKVASGISGSRIAGLFHAALMSEAQDIPTASTPYVDLESISRYPTIQSQPIILGFSLPPRYLSSTTSTSTVVNVFSQLVSFVRDCQAWDKYITGYSPIDNVRARVRDSSSTFS